MGLPRNQRRAETVQIGEISIDIRGLHLFQIRELAAMAQEASDAQAIAWATGCTTDEAREWIVESEGGDTIQLLAAIMRVSGWTDDAAARFPS